MTSPVRVAVVGYGYWGANLARNVQAAASTELVAIADASDDSRERAGVAHPGVALYAGLDPVLESDDVEAVVLSTPAGMHEDMAIKVLESGRHVLVEKPLATTVKGATRIVETADATGRVAMVGHTFLYAGPVRRLRALIEDGELGTIEYLYSQRLSLGRVRRDCNALWNFAPHDVSIMMYLLGDRPTQVSARGLSFIEPGIDDVCFATLQFASGVGANIHVSWIDPRKTRLMTVVGDEKMAIYNDVSVDQKLWIVDAGVAKADDFGSFESLGEFQWKTRAGDILIPKLDLTEPLKAELDAFGRGCAGDDEVLSDARHGAEVVAVLAAIDDSVAANGAPVDLQW